MARYAPLLALAAITTSVAAAQPAPPRVGLIRDASGSVWALEGVAGCFYPGPELSRDVQAFTYSASQTLLVDAERIALFRPDGSLVRAESAHASKAVAGLWDGTPIVWLPEENSLLIVRDRETKRVALKIEADDDVISVSGEGRSVLAAVRRDNRIQVVAFDPSNGFRLSAEPAATESQVFLLAGEGRVAWAEGTKVLIRDRGHATTELDARAKIVGLRQSARHWIQAQSDDGRLFIVRLSPVLELFEVPAQPSSDRNAQEVQP